MPNSYYENSQNTETTPEIARSEPMTEPQQNAPGFPDNSTGQLVVSVFTANQLIPVQDALVTVENENGNGNEPYTSTTDRNGRTISFSLPAPSASDSQEPTAQIPFAEYRITVEHPDYFKAVIENVQLFGSTLTLLPVNLVPIPEIANEENTKIVVIPRQNL